MQECDRGACKRVSLRMRAAALCCLALVVAQTAFAAEFLVRAPKLATPIELSDRVLSQEERAFIAGLPEIRVAVARSPARPYEGVEQTGEVTGIHPEMLAYLAQAFGLRLKPVVFPDWSSVLRAARAREVDLLMTLSVNPERLEYLDFTLGATPLPGALFARKGDAARTVQPDQDLERLETARFAIERDYIAHDFVRRQFPRATILTVQNTGEALAAVSEGRADYYLGSLLEAIDWLSRTSIKNIEVDRLLNFGSGFYHFAVRKDWPLLAAVLNKGLSTMRGAAVPAWSSATAALPPGVALPAPLQLNPDEAAQLISRPVWRIGAVRGLAMLNAVDARGVHSGIAAEYSEQVARRLGIGVQVVPFENVAAMLDALRIGSIDLVPFLTPTPQRDKEFVFSAPYFDMPYMLIARSDAPIYWGLASLRGRRLALAQQHPLREVLAQRFPEIVVVDAADGDAAMDMVARGAADAAVEVKLFANLRINSDNDGTLRAVAEVSELPARFHFAASRNAAALIPLVDRALADIPEPERQRMLRRWVAVDLKPAFPWRRYLPAIVVGVVALLVLAAATAWWMRRLTREVKARRRSEERLNDIGATMPCVAFRHTVDAQQRLLSTYYSSGAESFLGFAPRADQTLLDALGPRLRPEDLEAATKAQQASLASGAPFKFTGAYAHPDGRERWLHGEVVRTTGADGYAWTGYVADITTERELQAQVVREAQARNLLLASASHELRAPTNTLSLALQSLSLHGLDDEQQRALRIASTAARTLGQLLNDVLDVARLDAGGVRLQAHDFSLPELIEQLSDAYAAAAASRGLQFGATIDSDVPRMAHLYPLRLKQILTNLLSNAVKYTERGEVRLRVQRTQTAKAALRFTVTDTGRGIPLAQQERLFMPFVTGEQSPAVAEGSTGLGLTICRRLADLMGGTITLKSVLGRGTEAILEIPLPERQPETTPARMPIPRTAEPVDGTDVAGPVLLCDDNEISRMLLSEMLKLHDFEVIEASDGEIALDRWRAGDVHTLITDLQMPGMDGVDLIEAIRAAESGRLRRTFIIVCTGHSYDETNLATTQHDAYLSKPIDVKTLIQLLRRRGSA